MAIFYGIPDTERRLLKKLPKEVESIDDIPRVHNEMKQKLDSIEDKGLVNKFNRWNQKKQIRKFEKNRNSPLARGTKGELIAREKFSKLDDNYHVFCNVKISLDRPIKAIGGLARNAQIDFVVVSKGGIFCIEVKNWSDEYLAKFLTNYRKYGGRLPHEQVQRYGLILYVELSRTMFFHEQKDRGVFPTVYNVLLATHGNMKNESNFRVNVKDLNNINTFIQNRREIFSDKALKEIIWNLETCVH